MLPGTFFIAFTVTYDYISNMSNYIGIKGDTPELIARKKFGSELDAGTIRQANPGVLFPLRGGESVTIPASPDNSAGPLDLRRVVVKIDGRRFQYWNSIVINRNMDKISTVSLGCSFDPERSVFREVFTPFSYKTIQVSTDGELLFTGTVMNITPRRTEDSRTMELEAYGLPGVLNDCSIPEPREFLGSTLQQIANTLARPFGLRVRFNDAPAGGAFDKVDIGPGEKILEFLMDLARKRRLLVTDNPDGDLVFYRPDDTPPTATLTEGQSPLHLIAPKFNPQEYYSSITGIRSETTIPDQFADLGFTATPGGSYTVRNPFLKGVYRPHSYSVDDTNTGNLRDLVERKNRFMLANAISYECTLLDWIDQTGKLWVPYRTIGVTAPGAMIYTQNNFHIRSVSFRKDATSQTATMVLAVHGSFSGKLPEKLPWES